MNREKKNSNLHLLRLSMISRYSLNKNSKILKISNSKSKMRFHFLIKQIQLRDHRRKMMKKFQAHIKAVAFPVERICKLNFLKISRKMKLKSFWILRLLPTKNPMISSKIRVLVLPLVKKVCLKWIRNLRNLEDYLSHLNQFLKVSELLKITSVATMARLFSIWDLNKIYQGQIKTNVFLGRIN